MIMKRLHEAVDPFAPVAGAPPRGLWSFARWALRGAERAILLSFLVAFVTGLSELAVARFTGWVIDAASGTPDGNFWVQYWPIVMVGLGFFLVIRSFEESPVKPKANSRPKGQKKVLISLVPSFHWMRRPSLPLSRP